MALVPDCDRGMYNGGTDTEYHRRVDLTVSVCGTSGGSLAGLRVH